MIWVGRIPEIEMMSKLYGIPQDNIFCLAILLKVDKNYRRQHKEGDEGEIEKLIKKSKRNKEWEDCYYHYNW
ncbi:hypothetical protein D3Z55_21080 [Clostridiaceae bacterium]|nr:hypothetical protein [Clostridiaceae bacterium]